MVKERNVYTAFGFIIESDIRLPELICINEQVSNEEVEIKEDVKIIIGEVPENLEASIKSNPWIEAARDEFLLRVDGIAKYYVKDGEIIVIEPSENSKEEDIRVFLLSTVFGVLLQQRDFFVIHASAAVVDGKAIVFSGASESGKTAIALTLYDKGYAIICDELCAIKIENGEVMLLQGIPQLNVWKDTLEKAGKDIKAYPPIRKEINKYAFSVKDRYYEKVVEVTNIVILKSHNKDEIIFEEVKGIKKFDKLMRNSYRLDLSEVIASKENQFNTCVATCKNSDIIQVSFNEYPYKINTVVDEILKELKVNE